MLGRVASQLVTSPKIVFLDEPTSGLDSTASYEVMRFIKDIAKENSLVVIASIHQPSTTTFELFDKLVLLKRVTPAPWRVPGPTSQPSLIPCLCI